MTTVIIVAIALLLLAWLKARAAARKTPESRSSLETILVTLFTLSRRNLAETAATLRTPEVSREEGLQRCSDAIRELNTAYQTELTAILQTKANLAEKILPGLRKKPGYYNGKAQEAKRKYQEYLDKAEEPGNPNPGRTREMAEKYKQQGCGFLAFRAKALERIDKATGYLQNIDFTIDETKMTYESRKMELDDLRSELEMMIGSISGAKFEQSMSLIRSLKEETAGKLREQNARIEAESWISGAADEERTGSVSSEYMTDFDKL